MKRGKQREPNGRKAGATRTDAMPLDRILHIAAFRASLRRFLRESERISRRWGLTPQRYLLLLFIKGSPDRAERARVTDLAERLQLARGATTDLIARAEALGLVEREPSSVDLRVVYVRLTAEGERRLAGALLESDEYRRELIHGFEELAATFERASSRTGARRSTR